MERFPKCGELGVILLCGGLGTRLREETEFVPKPMVPIGGRPILWHIMRIFDAYGCRDFHLCLGYKAGVIKDYFFRYRAHSGSHRVHLPSGEVQPIGTTEAIEDWQVSLIDTGIDTLTGTRVKRALEIVGGDRFFLTYGDGVANIDLESLLAHHMRAGRLVTVTGVRPSSRFGELENSGRSCAKLR